MKFVHKIEAKDIKKMTESKINHYLTEYGEAEYQRGAISFMNYVDKHCHDKDEEICLDDDITILYENWKNQL